MKRVYLIGDSIRMGYDKYVRKQLAGIAEVSFPADNCRFAAYTLRYVREWIEKDWDPDTVDVIHWNAGLWDCGRYEEDVPFTDIPVYQDYLHRIVKRLRKICLNARQIFATSTPVIPEKYDRTRFMRYNEDIIAYNRAAIDVMTQEGVPVDDLHAVAAALDQSAWSDGTHLYTDVGTEALGNQVCRCILETLEGKQTPSALRMGRPDSDKADEAGEFETRLLAALASPDANDILRVMRGMRPSDGRTPVDAAVIFRLIAENCSCGEVVRAASACCGGPDPDAEALIRFLNDAEKIIQENGQNWEFAVNVTRIIRCNLKCANVNLISKELAVSRANFYRRYKAVFGEKLGDLITRLRMRFACGQLRTTDKDIKQIAADVGYDDINYFTRVFRRFTGVAPAAYRDGAGQPGLF